MPTYCPRRGPLLLLLTLFAAALHAQPNPYPPTPDAVRLDALRQRKALQARSRIAQVPVRSIGPTTMSGRVVDVEVNPADPTEFYVAYATGGVWHSTDHGISFTCVSDSAGAGNFVGDIAMDWSRRVLYLGTGENNSSRSSYAGTGLYVTHDNGKHWQHLGLAPTQHIGRVVLHPTDSNTLWVAALGNLYSPSRARGLYKSTDGGRNWQQTLFVNDTTGGVDLVLHPSNPDVVYAATWQRERRAWNFTEAGRGSGIYRSTDGGSTWTKLSGGRSGFPDGADVGRIGLAVSPADPERVYAVLDNQARKPAAASPRAITKDLLRKINVEDFTKLNADSLNAWLDENNFPKDYTARSLAEQVRQGKLKPVDLVHWLEDANAQLFDTPVTGAELYVSRDGGRNWQRTTEKPIADLFYSYGYYFAQVRADARDADRVYLLGVPGIASTDGGKSWTAFTSDNVHADHHALWVNPRRSGHLVLGTDGGLNISYDNGKTWMLCNSPAVGQFYAVAVDNAKPYHVYGGLQDNGVWKGPSTYRYDREHQFEGRYPYERLMGGDGMQVQVDPRDAHTVYTGFQFGNYFRLEGQPRKTKRITPQHKLGQRPYRWNWQTPILISPHQADIVYMGAHRLLRSFNRGDAFEAVSPDLTHGGQPGDVPYGTLTSISESPLRFGLLYTGSDDGRVHVSRDAGATWQDASRGLPGSLWVSRVEASARDTGTVWVSLNGYRWDDMTPYLYRSTDYGRNWQRLGQDLPAEPVNVVRHDPTNPDLLYVGTDGGLYVSLDGGQTFEAATKDFPDVPVHDLALQSREGELLVGTHGRSLYILPLGHIRQLTASIRSKALHLFPMDSLTRSESWGSKPYTWGELRQPDARIVFYAQGSGPAQVVVATAEGVALYTAAVQAQAGLNYLDYHATAERMPAAKPARKGAPAPPEWKAGADGAYYLPAGTYTVTVKQGGAQASTPLVVKPARKPAPRK